MQTIARNTNWKSNKPGSDEANEAIHVFGIIHKHTILAYTVICGEYFVHSNSLNWFAHLYAVHLEREPQQRLSRDASNNTQVKCARPKPTIYCLFGVMEAVGRVADQKRTRSGLTANAGKFDECCGRCVRYLCMRAHSMQNAYHHRINPHQIDFMAIWMQFWAHVFIRMCCISSAVTLPISN